MKKQFLQVICAILLIAVGCSQETIVDEPVTDDKPAVITLTAGMPDEGVQTRMGLEHESLSIKLTWEAGDQLQLCLKYGGNTVKQVTTVTNISPDGKTATFPVTLPEGSYTTFDLYGVYGGGGLSDTDPTKAILPSSAASTSGSLDSLKASKTVMLTFAQTGIEKANPTFSVDLNHLGSLFCIQLRNTDTTSWNNIKKVQLTATSTIPTYPLDNTGFATYDLTTGTFSGTASGNVLTFELPEATNLAYGWHQFWGWYPPVASQNWPEMKLEVIDGSGTPLVESTNSKPARTAPTPAGRAFYFAATYDGSELAFNDTNPVTDIDGNMYTTVVIGTQEWFAENLRTTRYNDGTPIPTGYSIPDWAGLTEPAYAVYPYTSIEGFNSEEEVLEAYGALYNWYAVNTKKLCPEGWHVPTDAEWYVLTNYLGGISGGGKLKSTRTDPAPHPRWNSANAGATDEYGFSALPGGYRSFNGGFNYVGHTGFWWSNTDSGADNAYFRNIVYDSGNVNPRNTSKKHGMAVRCIRDE